MSDPKCALLPEVAVCVSWPTRTTKVVIPALFQQFLLQAKGSTSAALL